MSLRRASLFVGGALLVTWFVAAAQYRRPFDSRHTAANPEHADAALRQAERLARDIQSQATRLRSRLATAPSPSASGRNPFAFQPRGSAPPPRSLRVSAASIETPPVISIDEPIPFSLSGIAEDDLEDDLGETRVRTAVLAGFGDVFLAKAGDIVASRYEVVAVGADAVELKDLSTGRTARLGLR